ncbi:titin-like isoform X3 [Contarinia nasturtii]|uniref:titin-like isoform X3 n=1 Tax=Contarinia nasturtii TaxID=265458 RepID=UPI0012D3A32F|nr:titin-like isoform X3 [Contarinia nasturtii]
MHGVQHPQYDQFDITLQQEAQFYEAPKGDESLPWRRSKTAKIRSRSLQPVRDIEKLPWLRSHRDRSVPKQPTFMQMHRGRVPVRPWIEEVIKLKRTELHQKVIERAKLEKVELKESQIERKLEFPHEELEKVDLKHLQWDADAIKSGQITQLAEWQQALLADSGMRSHDITHEDQMTILEVSKQLDELIQSDKSQGVPWEIQMKQLKTIERAQKIIDKFKVEEVDLKSMRQQMAQEHQNITNEQRIHTQDSNVLHVDQQSDIQMHKFGVQPNFMQQQQQQQYMQPLSYTEDTSHLKLTEHTQLNMKNIQQMENEAPHMWQRGMKQQKGDQGDLSYVEDSTVLSLKKKEQITQKYTDLNEMPVGWRRGPKSEGSILSESHVEISQIEDEQIEHREKSLPWMRQKKIGKGAVSHVDDTTQLELDEREEIMQPQLKPDEQPVLWKRGPKAIQNQQDTITQQELKETPVAWDRGKKVTKAHVEDTTALNLDQTQPAPQEEVDETPVMWRRGPKPQAPKIQETEQLIEERTDSAPKQPTPIPAPVEKVKPWTEEQVKLKPRPKTTETEEIAPKRKDSMAKPEVKPWTEEQVTLKTARRESVEIEKLKPAKDEVQLKPIKSQVQKPAEVQPLPEYIEEVIDEKPQPQEPEIEQATPWRRGEKKKSIEKQPDEKQWPKGKRKPKTTEETETVELKPVQHEKPEEKQPEQHELKPIDKEVVDQVPRQKVVEKKPIEEAKQWPKGKQIPKPVEEVEKVELQPIPRKKLEEAKTKEEPELKPVKKDEVIVEAPTEPKETTLPKVHGGKAQIKAPKFVRKLKPELCKPNEPTLLIATVEGTPFPEVKWFFNDAEVYATENYEMNVVEKVVTLKIAKVTPDTIGTYSCQVKNEAGVAISRANIALAYEYVPDSEMTSITLGSQDDLLDKTVSIEEETLVAPKIVKKLPTVVQTKSGETAVLEVKVIGKPTPTPKWLKADEEIIPSDVYLIENYPDGTSVLTIASVQPDVVDQITFEAVNPVGKAKTATELQVEEIVGTKEYRQPEWVTQMEEMREALKAAKSAPSFVVEIVNKRVLEGESVKFECQFSGTPIPDILWYHNMKFLKSSDNVKIDTNIEEMKSTCEILKVSKENCGFYTCKAINDVKEETTKAKLDLTYSGGSASTQKNTTETKSVIKETNTVASTETVKAASKIKSEKKMKTQKKTSQTQKASKEERKTELIISQTQKDVKQEIETGEMEETTLTTANKAHLEVVREDERISDASLVNITTKSQRFEDEDVEIIEETEEIHVKIYKEVFSVEEMERFKVADEVNSILEKIEAHQFGSGERPLRELATVGHLLKKGIEINEIIQLYDANFFPALKIPESQSALVQLVERQGYENLIADILNASSSEDENLLASTVGFRAFIRMVEVTKIPIEEIITNFKCEDFVSQEWKHKEVKENEFVEVTESHVSSIRAEKISIIEKASKEEKLSTICEETSDQKSTVFVTRFESSADGIKSTTSKIADVEGVLIEEVLSEPEQEKVVQQGDVFIEEVRDTEVEEEIKTEVQPEEEKSKEEQPKKKKIVKKVKKDDLDYIQKLIDMEIPKTQLEVFEKPEFEDVKKKKKSLVPTTDDSEDVPSQLIVEELPEEVVTLQVPTETGEIVEQKVTKRKIKKKQGDNEQVIEVITVEEEGKEPETEVTIEEVQPSVGEEEEETPESVDKPEKSVVIEEVQPTEPKSIEQPKLKKKKVTKKAKKDDKDDYIQKLIDQEIPKTELEVFEKPEFDEITKKPKKKKLLVSKTSEEEEKIDEQIEEEEEETSIHSIVEEQPEETVELQLPKKDSIKPIPIDDVTDEVTVVASTKKEDQIEEQITEKVIKKKRRPKEIDAEAEIEIEKQPDISTVIEEIERIEVEQPDVETPIEIVQPEETTDEAKPEEEKTAPKPVEPTESTDDRRTSVSKTKKKIKKKKTSDLDEDYIQKLLDQEIPKTELEKFEKLEFEKPQKKLPEKGELVPMKIERKEQKPTKVKVVPVEEVKPIKLKPKKPKQIEPEVESKSEKPRLKSRITYVDIEEPMSVKITDIGAVKDHGELSRNIEEAEEVLKSKPKKFKHKPQRKDSLERPELEVYEKYESSSDESSKKESYQRTKKEKPDETTDTKTLKLGKGKPVDEDETIEKVKLKPTVKEEKSGEESVVEKQKKLPEAEVKEDETKPEPEYELKPLDQFESEPEKAPLEDVEKFKDEKEPKAPEEEKPKRFKKKKTEPIPEITEQPLKLGEPKEAEDTPEEELKLGYKQKPLPEETTEEVVLKPLKKDKKETEQPEEETVHEIKLVKKPDVESTEGEEAKVTIKKKKQQAPKGEDEAAMDVVVSLKKKKPTDEDQEVESEDEAQFTLANVPLKQDQTEDVEAQISLKPKITRKTTDEAAEDLTLTLTPQQPDEEQNEVVFKLKQPVEEGKEEETEESAVFTIEKPTKDVIPEDVSEKLKIKKKKSKKETAADEVSIVKEVVVEPEPITIEEIVEDVQFVEKPTEPDLVEYPEEVVEQPEMVEQPVEITEHIEEPKPIEVIEKDEDVTIKKKKKPKKQPTEESIEDVTLKKPSEEQPEVEQEDVVLKLKKPTDKTVEEEADDHTVFTIGKKTEEGPAPEDVSEKLKIKKKKSKKQAAADELSITKEIVIEPEPITVEEIVEDVQFVEKPIEEEQKVPEEVEEKPADEDQVTIKKPKKKKTKTDEVEATVSLKSEKEQPTEDVNQDVTLKKRKEVKFADIDTAETIKVEEKPESDNEAEFSLPKRIDKQQTEDIESEITIRKEDSDQSDVEDVVAEFTVKKKKEPKPAVEEHNDEYTIKKLKKRRRSQVEIPEHTDVEHVTFRPRSTKTKEDVEQEFNIQLDSYAEEEISMSGKIKLKKTKPPTFSEEGDEAHIKITEQYDDKEGPIIEEIDDDESAAEDTMYDIDEPEEFSDIEELPEHVEFKLKPRKSKPYVVEDLDEEFAVGFTHRKKPDVVSYGEDSFTLRTPSRRLPSSYLEEASLFLTRDEIVDESIKEEDIMYSYCTYIAENAESLNLVEGEKVYVLEKHNIDWWWVKKPLTSEKGWVPSQCLMDANSYKQYVETKLNEKIDKLPVFEKPGPSEKTFAPKFIEKLQPITTPDGYTIQFECRVEGNPRPQITWFRQTAIIKQSQDFQMYYDDDNVATLVIREVFPEDSGTFTCVAKNSVGYASSTTELTVEGPLSDHGSEAGLLSRKSLSRESSMADILEGIPPTFSKKPRAQYVDENTNVILKCSLVAVPEPEIYWLFNGEEIQTENNVKIVTESDMHMYLSVVHITKVQKVQEGTYEVVARNREGESRLPIQLKVRTKDKEPPQILEPLHSQTIREGESVILNAQIVGNPTPKITWLKDGKPITANVKSDKDTHSLTLISPNKDAAGVYTVKAVNPVGSIETTANLTIEEHVPDLEPPFFIERFEEQTVPQNSEIILLAKVSGHPTPEITWLRNNVPLKPSDRVEQTFDGKNVELRIKNADADKDSGDYKLVASSPLGKVSHGARVIVEVDDVVFTKQLKKTISIQESQTLTLECETSHYTITKWYHNGKELTGMDHRIVSQEDKVHKLIVKDTTPKDAGTYKCTIKNHETSSTVEVIEKVPQFVKTIDDFEVKELETAILEVEITSDTADVTWLKDGQPLKEEPEKIVFVKDGKVRKLLIKSSNVIDEGEYTCQLAEEACTAEVSVIELPPEIVKKLENVTVAKGETAVFEIELTKGDAFVKWFKGKKEIHFDDHVQLTIDGKIQRLKVFDTEPEDEAKYSCKVGNQVSTAKLFVEEPDVQFIVPLPDVTLAPKNTDVELTVTLSQPDVEVTWCKNGKPIKDGPKHSIDVEGTVRRLVIKDADDDDIANYTCIAGNTKSNTQVKLEENQLPPTIQLKENVYKVQENEDVTFTIPFTGSPKPEAEWFTSGTVVKPTPRKKKTMGEDSATLTIKKVADEDAGEYTIKLTNPVGDVQASLTLIILKPPSAPGKPEPLEVASDSLTLFWKAPEEDGNDVIIEYILEYKEKISIDWTQITQITDTSYKVDRLKTDSEYAFRVSAVNNIGQGPPSPISEYIRTTAPFEKEKPTIIEPLADKFIGLNEKLVLSSVIGGNPVPKVTWYKNKKTIESEETTYENRVTKYIIEKTTIETEADYTCVAENEMGTAETTCRVKIQEKPTITIEDKYINQKIRKDKTYTIKAIISGYPEPAITWCKEAVSILTDSRVKITHENCEITLTMTNVEREDSGKYTITIKNSAGETTVDLTLKVIDKPERPTALDVTDIKKDSVVIAWTPPIDDGGLDITKYGIEKCDPEKMVWIKVAEVEKTIVTYCVQKLLPNAQYIFRVVAENPIGASEPIESNPVTIKLKIDVPSAPRPPIDVSGMTKDSLVLSWKEPEKNGGSKVLDYIVEFKESTQKDWKFVGTTEGNQTYIHVKKLKQKTKYIFKICARNEAGVGLPLITDEPITVDDKITPPSPPQNLTAMSVTSKSVTLQWEPPLSNGGSDLTGYVVEKRLATLSSSIKWTRVVTLDSYCLQYCIDNLKEKSEYVFRVLAENEAGLSAPATTENIVLKTHATVPSPPTAPLEVRGIGVNTSIFEWGIPESDGGAPLEGYNIAIRDMKRTMWIEVGRVSADVQRFQIRDLQEDHEYMIRIFARNEVGLSEPLESEEPYKVLPMAGPDLGEEGKTDFTEPTGYSTENTSSWLRDHNMDADISSYARSKLLRKDEYFFRIWHHAGSLFK